MWGPTHRKVADVLDLVLLAALLHVLDGLFARKLVDLELQVLLADLAHLLFDAREVLLGDFLALRQVDIVVEAIVGCRAECEVGIRVQALDGLCHDMGCGVADYVELLVLGAFCDVAVVVQNLHLISSSIDGCLRCSQKEPGSRHLRPPSISWRLSLGL